MIQNMHGMSGSQPFPIPKMDRPPEERGMGLGNWLSGARERVAGWDRSFAENAATREADLRRDVEAIRGRELASRQGYYLTQDPKSVAGEVAELLNLTVKSKTPPEVVAARDTLSQMLYGGTAPSEFGRGQQSVIQQKLTDLGVGSRVEADSASYALNELRNALAAAHVARTHPGALQQGLADWNQRLSMSPKHRAGLYAATVGGTVPAAMALTEAGQQLLQLAGFLAEGEQTEARAETSELA